MSAYDQGPLAKYNSLTDRHLMSYFSNDRMRRHLVKNGLITKGGEVVSDAVYRVRIARREHRRRVRDLIAQAIIHKALEMERSRQIDIRKKIEEIAKIELVRRVRSDCNRLGDEECLSYFNEGNMEPKSKPKPQKSGSIKSRPDLDESRLPRTPDQESRLRLRKLLPNEEIETKHLSQLDSLTLGEYARILEKQDQYRIDKLPYLGMGSELVHKKQKVRDRKGSKSKKKKQAKKDNTEDSQDLNGAQSARSTQTKTKEQPIVSILFHAPAANRSFDVMVVQQPSGGNTLILYKESISNNTIFQVTSHRHKGFPFSMTFYIDNVTDSRISTCCEYKHKVGKRIGGPSGHFSLFSVEGDDRCFRCLAELDLANEKKEKKAKDTKSNEQLSSRHETISVRSASEDRYKSDNDFESSSESSASSEGEEKEEQEDEEGEKEGSSHSEPSTSNKKDKENAIISVNISNNAHSERTKTPEIEVNNEDVSDKEDDVKLKSSNNNALEVDHVDGDKVSADNANVNSGRTSIWTDRSDQQEHIHLGKEGKGEIYIGFSQPTTVNESDLKNEHEIINNGDKINVVKKTSISSSSSSSSSSSKNVKLVSPIEKPMAAVSLSSDEESEDDSSLKVDTKNKANIKTNGESENEESSSKEAIVPVSQSIGLLKNPRIDDVDSNLSVRQKSGSISDDNDFRSIGINIKQDEVILEEPTPKEDSPLMIDKRSSSSGGSTEVAKEERRDVLGDGKITEQPVEIQNDMGGSSYETSSSRSSITITKEEPGIVDDMKPNSTIEYNLNVTHKDEHIGGDENTNGEDRGENNDDKENDEFNGNFTINLETNTSTDNVLLNEDVARSNNDVDEPGSSFHFNNLEDRKPMEEPIKTPRKVNESSESSAGDYTSSSEIDESNSLSSVNKNPKPLMSNPVLSDTERESLKIDIPKDEEDDNIPQNNNMEEPHQSIESPRLTKARSNSISANEENTPGDLNASSSYMSTSSSYAESGGRTPIKVENQAEEENHQTPSTSKYGIENKGEEDSSLRENNSTKGINICFVDDDITFIKAKNIFKQSEGMAVKSLTVKNCELPSHIFEYIAENLNAEKDLKTIELSGCKMEISLLKILAKRLDKWPLLDTLILSNNVFADYSLFDLLNVIISIYNHEAAQNLKLFDVANCNLHENDISQIIRMIAGNTNVERIILDHNSINKRLWQDLRGALENNSTTKSVSIKNCVTDSDLFDEIDKESSSGIRSRLIID